MLIEINEKTPSINHLYYHVNNQKIITGEARKLRSKIEGICMDTLGRMLGYDFDEKFPLKINIIVYEKWLTKKGLLRKADLLNKEKFLVDSIFKGLGIDDKLICKASFCKIPSNKDKTIVEIDNLNEEELKLIGGIYTK